MREEGADVSQRFSVDVEVDPPVFSLQITFTKRTSEPQGGFSQAGKDRDQIQTEAGLLLLNRHHIHRFRARSR